MGFLFSSPTKNNAVSTPALTGMPVQTSCYGKPLAIVYGTTRVGCNLIWYANFVAIAHNNPSSSGGGGGKGGVFGGGGKGGGGGSVSYTYQADLALAISEGPIDTVGAAWQSQTLTSLAALALALYPGAYGQPNWDGNPDTNSGVSFAAAQAFQLGDSAQLPNFNFEVLGCFAGTAPGAYGGNGCQSGGDADPSLVVADLLANPHYGAGFPANRIGEMASNNEAHAIPASGPYTVAVTNAASFQFNLDVVDGSGNIYQCVASSPGALQYSFNPATGVYTFSSANAGTAVTIRYASLNGSLPTYQQWALGSGLWISPGYDTATQASSLLDDIGTFTYASWVWSAGALKLVPRGTMPVAANGYSYTPPSAPLFALTDNDFLPNTNATGTASAASNDDPVILTRTRPSDQINDIKIEFLDRANQYAASIAECTDQANIDAFGRRPPSSLTGHLFCDANAANTSAQLQMQDQYIRNTYSFTLDARYCVLDPMDIVSLTDSYLGLSNQWVRLTEITENDDGTLSITAEEYPTGTGAAATYALNVGQGYFPNFNQAPGSVNAPILFAMPVALASNQGLEIACALSGASPLWGGCDVYISSDGSTYRLIGRQTMPARMGVTTADFPAGADPDTVNTLAVNLSESHGQLVSGTQEDADDDNTLAYVGGANGGEFVSYQQATLTAPNQYNLGRSGGSPGYLRRGQQQTPIVDHPLGSPFARVDAGLFAVPYTADQIGQTMYLKFASFNIWGGGEESLASVTAYEVTLPAPPAPPDVENFSAQQNGNVVAFSWDPVPYPTNALAGYVLGYAAPGTLPITTQGLGYVTDTTGAATVSLTLPSNVPAGALLVVYIHEETGTWSPGGVADSGGINNYTNIGVERENNGGHVAAQYYAYDTSPLAAGQTITYTKNTAGNNASIGAFYATGIQASSDPLDTAVTAYNYAFNTSPSVTSGAPTVAGELFFGIAVWSGPNTFGQDTSDAAWGSPPGLGEPDAGVPFGGGTVVNAGTGPLTYAPSFTGNVAWATAIFGFMPALASNPSWSQYKIIDEVGAGTSSTNADIPRGEWVFGIRAASVAYVPGTQIGLSPDIATAILQVTNENEVIYSADEAPLWNGTRTNLCRHYLGLLIRQGSKNCNAYVALSPPAAPALSQSAGGSLGSRTYYAKATYVDASGETLASSEASLAISAGNLAVASLGGTPPLTATGWNLYAATGSGAEKLQNATPIALGSPWDEPATGLVSGASPPAANSTGWQVFDVFCPDPQASGSYSSNAIDTGYNDDLRVNLVGAATYALGPAESGTPSVSYALDTWLTGETDPATFTSWTIGYVEMRYARFQLDDGSGAGAIPVISHFVPVVDVAPATEQSGNVSIAPGGTTVTFPQPFHAPPQIAATVIAGSGLYATAVSVTATQATFHVWNSSGVDVGGTINYLATGE